MKKQLVIIGIMVLLTIIGLSGCTETSDDIFNVLRYVNEDYGFGLNPPEGWTIEETGGGLGTTVIFLGPTEDNFSINMVISADTLDIGETLNSKVDEVTDMYASNENFSLLINDETTINGMNAYEIVYTMNILKQKMILVEKNAVVIILVYSALETSYNNYSTVFENSVNSLVIE